MPKLILASTSKPRQLLLQRLQIPFEIAAPNVDETPLPDENPQKMVVRLAIEKSQAVAEKYPNALIIGADQVGVLDNQILGKPLTRDNAIKQLNNMSGQKIRFFIGLCLLNTENQTKQTILETFDVYFRKLTSNMIDNYLDKEDALNCAGSVKIEGLGITLIEKLAGDDYTALIGLPLIKLTTLLSQHERYQVI